MVSSTAHSASTAAVAAATSSAVSKTLKAAPKLKIVGIILAVSSGTLIGSSFVFKKKGLLRSQAGGVMGEGVAYLKSPLWWTGMTMMIMGELCNFAAYAFVEAIIVTPLGALSVVICAILSSFFLNERLSFFGWLGCTLCILGSIIIALNGPQEATVGQITAFQKLFLAPGFLSYIAVLISASLVIVFYFAPKYGKKSMLWYIFVCSMIGGISVSVTTGLGAAIVQTAFGDNQFTHWFIYFLFGFVAITLVVEVYYLNVALALFNTAMVTPTYYVIFTFFSMVTTIVLFQGLSATATQIITIVMGFLVICLGITILQMSKVDPEKLSKLDRRSTFLLQAARAQTFAVDEKRPTGYEDPGMDTLRGSFGAFGSIIRANTAKRMSQSTQLNKGTRPSGAAAPYNGTPSWISGSGLPPPSEGLDGIKRHQLYDTPMPRDDSSSVRESINSQLPAKKPAIKFDSQEIVHSYSRPGEPPSPARHEQRQAAAHNPGNLHEGYPPLRLGPDNRSTTVSEANLLGIDAVASKNDDDVATMYRALPRPPGQAQMARKDSRDIFDSPVGSRSTLLSFPSVTDSSPSDWDPEEMERLRLGAGVSQSTLELERNLDKSKRGKERSRERDRTRSPRKYPRGLDIDDKEESENLFHKTSLEGSEEGLPPPDIGSIRLVSTGLRKNQI